MQNQISSKRFTVTTWTSRLFLCQYFISQHMMNVQFPFEIFTICMKFSQYGIALGLELQ